jgi:hypothetical protein
MGEAYRVVADPSELRRYQKNGEMVVWNLVLEQAGATELHMRPTSQPPTKDSEIRGDVREHEFQGETFKRFYKEREAAWTANGSSTGGKSFERRPDHPKVLAHIARRHAQGLAPSYYELLRTEGVLPQATDEEAAWAALARIATRLEERTLKAVEDAEG